ncbi:bifunctional DNA-formamidopyrimidine glycosylase/DNA-(apurinic or apyrimidinic site) lyase [Jonesia quinghaiensis]|uniref:bifunctional DNA-formamidopyrimidine glycosylase/DNA-(apurinic or apyrimidinic site) lyase n=1 Tax=Jonesia quinghaiensis TaxID=262806 RepID=UPI000407FFDF|nr:bifunctional DNA-formamidopyrimidine glycosylase/DNA-(apurinic or apyrimidinic site) lyase [Jonesia quinghaiensis]
MPELPEVETVRDGLERHIIGATITRATVLREYSVRRHLLGPEHFVGQVAGQVVTYAARRGKFLWLGFEGCDDVLVAHLGMSGQLLVRDAEPTVDSQHAGNTQPAGDSQAAIVAAAPVHPHLRVRFDLDHPAGKRVLDFVDQRTFGYLAVTATMPTSDGLAAGWGTEQPVIPDLAAHIARDALDPAIAPGTPGRKALVARLATRPSAIKRLILDQSVISGIGNIYADESLWRAKIHGERPTNTLSKPALNRLLDHAVDVMGEALTVGGTSFDALYVNVNGQSGYFDRSLNVYGRENKPCRRCGSPIRRSAFMNRSSFWCPRCQPRPRPLT